MSKPLRSCAACRKRLEKEGLLRVVKSPEGKIYLDLTGKAAGRGAYVCKNQACIDTLIKKRGINRAFKTDAGNGIYNELREYLESQNLHRLCDKGE
jgi:predicted RNA-binding protein YlxR (DUF448 family)